MASVTLVYLALCVFGNAFLLAFGHSTMTDPQSISPGTCRLGGEPQFGVLNCPGPCDLRAVNGKYSNYGSENNPARVFRRGEMATIKYQRNNHGPGGFIRLTLVRPEDIMDKEAHERNAFHYSCWGANPVQALPNELERDKYGFTFVGSDGEQHEAPKGYYITKTIIPTCIPDGSYVLGWVWFGGTGGTKIENNEPQEPKPWGYFGDYWACSFVRVEGGDAISSSCEPVFQNDMRQFSEIGCMSANNIPGTCASEPCRVEGKYQKPLPFADGKSPLPLTPNNFGGVVEKSLKSPIEASPSHVPAEVTQSSMESFTPSSTQASVSPYMRMSELSPSSSPTSTTPITPRFVPNMEEEWMSPSSMTAPTPTEELTDPTHTPETIFLPSPASEMGGEISAEPANVITSVTEAIPVPDVKEDFLGRSSGIVRQRSCRCYLLGPRCSRRLADSTRGFCSARLSRSNQLASCAQRCCEYCQPSLRKGICLFSSIKRICQKQGGR